MKKDFSKILNLQKICDVSENDVVNYNLNSSNKRNF